MNRPVPKPMTIKCNRGHSYLLTYIDSTHVYAQNIFDDGELGGKYAMHIAEFDPQSYPGVYDQVHAFTHNLNRTSLNTST